MVGEAIAGKVIEGASENLVEIEGDIFREVKEGRKKHLVPVRVKVGVNPLNLITAAAAGAVGLLGATIAWHGISLPTLFGPVTLFPGIKDTGLGLSLRERFPLIFETDPAILQAGENKRINEQLGRETRERFEAKTCDELRAMRDQAFADGNIRIAQRFQDEMDVRGCPP